MLSATLSALREIGLIERSLERDAPVAELLPDLTPSGFGYLRVGLHSLACAGWIADGPALDPAETFLHWTDAGHAALEELPKEYRDGAFAVPLLVAGRVREVCDALGWSDEEARELAGHVGLVGSYLPLLSCLGELYTGRRVVSHGEAEWHVDRALNIEASGLAHRRYFSDADAIFVELFDREPLETQPRFVADMGCGGGSWLEHVYALVRDRTRRGAALAEHPLLMVGLDYSGTALARAQLLLDGAGVPALLLPGDVTDPDRVAEALAAHDLEMRDGLHIRAFIDHDRDYHGAPAGVPAPGWSSGAYVDDDGGALAPAEVERDLTAHLRRWAPHVERHGLVVVEAHSVAPRVVSAHRGTLHSLAFEAYHGYSHQYPIEFEAFRWCCRQAGLQPSALCERRYPATRPFTAVSVNKLVVPQPSGASAPPGDEDGEALHLLLYIDGDLRFPRSWASTATGFVVAAAIEAIEARLASAQRGETIRVLDYGTGTGLAAIELLKACAERRLEERLERAGVGFELHLVDLPSSWFDKGRLLLGDSQWTHFHDLRDAGGRFVPLAELTGGPVIDALMVSMVFHLIPPSALSRVGEDLAGCMRPGARLSWSSPDLGPPGPYAVLFHDTNRELRRRWLERVEAGGDNERAGKRILREPNQADAVVAALREHFDGEVARPTYELLAEDIVDTLLVPANQREFLPEIEDRAERERVIVELMRGEVIPALQAGPAGTPLGLNVQWTLGDFSLQK